MSRDRSKRAHWTMVAVKVLIVVAVLLAVRHTVVDAVAHLGAHPWRFDPAWPAWLLLAGVLYLLGLLSAGLFWHHVLLVLGQDARCGESLRAYFLGHLGKYVPGKAMVVVIRAGAIRSHRVDTAVAAVSVFFETLTMMSVGAFLAAGVLALHTERTLLFWVAIGLMVAAGVPTMPSVFRRLVRLAGVGRSDPSTREKLGRLGYATLLIGWLAMTLAWALLGLSLWAVFRAMGVPGAVLAETPVYTASVALATVAGFLSLVPGGAVVREAILTGLLAPSLGESGALVSAVVLRLVWLVCELLVSGILTVVRGASSRR